MAEAVKKAFRASAIIAALLFVIDAFVLALPFFALGLIAVVLAYFLPAALWALRSDTRTAKLRVAKAGIYLFTAISIFVTLALQNSMADRRAVKLGDACLAYRAKYHRYPKDLKALVPEFIPSVPVARYAILGGDRFIYSSLGNDREPMLYYEAVPPFGRRFYHMESRSWGYLD